MPPSPFMKVGLVDAPVGRVNSSVFVFTIVFVIIVFVRIIVILRSGSVGGRTARAPVGSIESSGDRSSARTQPLRSSALTTAHNVDFRRSSRRPTQQKREHAEEEGANFPHCV